MNIGFLLRQTIISIQIVYWDLSFDNNPSLLDPTDRFLAQLGSRAWLEYHDCRSFIYQKTGQLPFPGSLMNNKPYKALMMTETLNLTDRQKTIIASSWRIMKNEAGPANSLFFYDAFFKEAPEAKKYFMRKGDADFKVLQKKFDHTIGFITDNSHRLDKVTDAIKDLGTLHNRLKIDHKYYDLFNKAVLNLLDDVLKEKNTPEIREAWTIALEHIEGIMIQAPDRKENKFKALLDKLFGKNYK